jgi:diacylglycerol kinase (ATP)
MSKKSKTIRVKLIANPGAGIAAEAADNLKLVAGYLKMNGLKADVVRAKPKTKATPLARQAVKDGYKIVIVMGGDGTVEAVMRGVIGSKARLGIVPAGMENNIAKSLGIPANLKAACALIASGNTCRLDVGQVKTGKGKWLSFFEMAGVGLSSDLVPDGTRAVGGESSAPLDATPAAIQEETKPKVFLNLDDERIIKVESMLVMVTNTAVFGKKFLVTPNASLKDGFLDISVFQGFGKDDLRGYYASMMAGGYSGNGKVRRYQARKLKVKSSPKMKVIADGIELGKGMVMIKMRLGALRVIANSKNPGLESLPKDEVIPVPAEQSLDQQTTPDVIENPDVPVSPIEK